MPKYKVQLSDGTSKTIYWDKPQEPTDQELIDAPEYVESKPSISSRFMSGIIDPAVKLYEGVRDTGKAGAQHIREGNYPAAFHDIASPILHPFEGIMDVASGHATKTPGTELAEQAGIPLSSMKKSYDEGDYAKLTGQGLSSLAMLALSAKDMRDSFGSTKANAALLESPKPPIIEAKQFHNPEGIPPLAQHGPPQITAFEGLTKPKETPSIDLQNSNTAQPELNLEFDPKEVQQNLPYRNYKERYGDKYAITGPRQPELFDVPNANQSIVTKAMVPSPLEPTVNSFGRPTWSRFAEQRNLPLEYDTLQAAETNPIPEIQQAAKQVAESKAIELPSDKTTFSRNKRYTNFNPGDGTFKSVGKDWFVSNYSRLVKDSPAGKNIARMVDKYRAEVSRTSGSISAALKEVVNPLNKSQYAEFQRLLDTGDDLTQTPNVNTIENLDVKGSPVGYKRPNVNPLRPNVEPGQVTNRDILSNTKGENLPPTIDTSKITLPPEFNTSDNQSQVINRPTTDPMVQNALDVARSIDRDFTERATNSGMHLKTSEGELIPFTGKENYWPRIYPPEMFKDKPALVEKLIKQGMSPDAAFNAVNNARRFGERLIDPQNQRILDLPNHRKDFGALLKHYNDMAHRVVGSEVFGVKDIADPESAVSQLVAQTKDPTTTGKIMRQFLDREGGVAPYEADFAKKISKFTTAFYLSKFAISNTNQMAFVPVQTSFKATGQALRDFITSPKKTWKEAEATGALQTVMQEAMREVGGESPISTMYGIKASEGSNRTISAIAGKYYIKDLFEKVQKNPNNVRARKSLEDLTLENWDNLKNQTELTDKQQAYAATRVVEKTQGRAQSIDLPYNWDKSPYTNLILLYKKYAFVQGRLLKDTIKQNPKNAMLLLGLFNLFGEGTGDAKAAISGSVSGMMNGRDSASQAIADRGKNIGTSSPVVNRILQNYIDSMFLGLAGDALNSARSGTQAMYQTAAGPIIGGAIDTAGNIQADFKNPPKSIKKSQFLRGMASHVPYIGSGINRGMRK